MTIEEVSGTQFPDLTTAQNTARSALAVDLATTIRELLAAGVLLQVNGQIILNKHKRTDDHSPTD